VTVPSRLMSDRTTGARTGLVSAGLTAVALGIAGAVGILTGQPWLFPSLGPTVMVLAETPEQPAANPVNVLVGHLVGILAGYGPLLVTGLTDTPPVLVSGIDTPRVIAAALSVAVTTLVLQSIGRPHPPAGATTLIVSLGLLITGRDLITMMLAVAVVTGLVTALNAAFGARQDGVGTG
jgi:hypothetical protein